jgi:hypothetical protein
MPSICIPTPPLNTIKTVDVDVSIDGRPRQIHYRVETLELPPDQHGRIEALRTFIAERGDDWLLIQIGSPSQDRVPLLFRQRAAPDQSLS